MRSALDHAAAVIVSSAKTGQWNRKSSFNDLRKLCVDDKANAILGEDWVQLVRDCDWFDEFREWRLSLAHHGAMTITFFDAETIPFQIHQRHESKVNLPEIKYKDWLSTSPALRRST